jgi:hypothetical protein
LTPVCRRIKLTGVAKLLARIVKLLTPKRRWAQFSLATMFLVVSLLCVGLALVVGPAERQRRAVAAIEALGGQVLYAPSHKGTSDAFLRRWLARDYFDEIREVSLGGTQVTDADLDDLQALKGLKWIWLVNTQITDAGLAHLHRLTALKSLDLNGTQVTDAGLAHLNGLMRLEALDLNGTQVTDAGLTHLQGLTGLKLLWLGSSRVTDAGLAHLHGLAELQELNLSGCQVTDAGLTQLRQALPNCKIKR